MNKEPTQLWILTYEEESKLKTKMNFFNLPSIGDKSIILTKEKIQDNEEVFKEVKSLIKTWRTNVNQEEKEQATKTILSIYELVKNF